MSLGPLNIHLFHWKILNLELLCDDFRAKVSDFGLVELAQDGDKFMATTIAGTFG